MKSHKKSGGVSSFVFCEPPQSKNKSQLRTKGDSKSSQVTSFFYGTEKGSIVYADDRGHCTDVFQQPSAIDCLLYFEEKSRLVAINSSYLLTQYQVSDDGKLSRTMQIKLSVSTDFVDKGAKSFTWAGPGILAMATQEKLIRFFDLAVDESYNISLTSSLGGFIDRSDRVCHVAFSPTDRYLAAGTHMGVVAIWKFIGSFRDLSNLSDAPSPTGPSDWEVNYSTILHHGMLFNLCFKCNLVNL